MLEGQVGSPDKQWGVMTLSTSSSSAQSKHAQLLSEQRACLALQELSSLWVSASNLEDDPIVTSGSAKCATPRLLL
jgi:hypothetical protein